ncbi:protein GrpE [Fulvitalea axinellae]|uniref:Protein GrpE n=1 Tax=Fulvitalea axinellae TaxID=1182444 RepID=A0AAU9DF25_9BACT|nr:protein GrpE [Fulvitalea axinellae]
MNSEKDKQEQEEKAKMEETKQGGEANVEQQEELLEEESHTAQENEELAKLQEELDKEKDKYLRMYSEYENFRRRTAREKLDLIKTANESIFKALLPIVDDFERAEASFEGDADKETMKEGFALIMNKLNDTLKREGMELIEVKAGDDFDTETQEAITQIPAPSPELKGKIVDVVEKGYKIGDKVIRYAKVVIGA